MAIQPHFVGSMTLKALLEDPNLKNPPIVAQSSSSLKIKKETDSTELPQFNYGSAFLGPNLWDRTYDGLDFNLEYMDLDEFLSENGIVNSDSASSKTDPPAKTDEQSNPGLLSVSPSQLPVSPRQFLKSPPLSPSQFGPADPQHSLSPSSYPSTHSADATAGGKSPSPPCSPFNVEFQVSQQDLALSSIPDYGDGYVPKWQVGASCDASSPHNGQEDFDPRKRNFTEEELKPQPIIKKSKKVFVPDDLKDDKYWARRHKNNYAAKRSRDARRVKENQIAMRAAFLEKENSALRDEVNKLRKENVKLKSTVSKYEMSDVDTVSSSSILGLP